MGSGHREQNSRPLKERTNCPLFYEVECVCLEMGEGDKQVPYIQPETSDEEGHSSIPGWSFQEQEAQMNFHTRCFPWVLSHVEFKMK